jgi:hypothetical protein
MKTIYSAAMIGFLMFLCMDKIQAQRGTEADSLNNLTRPSDRIYMLEVARYIDNVDYSDTHDRSILMYA